MSSNLQRAKYGAEAFAAFTGELPTPFPRIMGPNAAKYLQEVVDSGLTEEMIARCEQHLAGMLGMKHAIGTPGCTAAMGVLGATLATRFEAGDEIIFSPISDYGTFMGFIKENFIPVFADTEPGSPNISAATIEPHITKRTRAIVCVHKTGLMCDMDPIMDLARTHNLLVIEDACQAFQSTYKGRAAGTIGHIGAFSFDSEKTIGSDVGGALVTNDDELAEQFRLIGQSRGGVTEPGFGRKHTVAGLAYRMSQSTAAVTLAQLEIAQDIVDHRDKMIRRITDGLSRIEGIRPLTIPDYQEKYSCWMLGINVEPDRFNCSLDDLGQQMAEAGIPGMSSAYYYLMPEAITFLDQHARAKRYPYSTPPTSREYRYGLDTTPTARAFLDNFLRTSTFCEKYTQAHCDRLIEIVETVVKKTRR